MAQTADSKDDVIEQILPEDLERRIKANHEIQGDFKSLGTCSIKINKSGEVVRKLGELHAAYGVPRRRREQK